MAIFKKLNIGDTVATSGTRVFKKLTTESKPLTINGTYLFNKTITEMPIVNADAEELDDKTVVMVNFLDSELAEGTCIMMYDNKLFYYHFLPIDVYSYDTNSWEYERSRLVTFNNALAKNYNGEDVTPIFHKWLATNTVKQGQITFTIDGITYTADEGTRWGHWLKSTHNTDNFITSFGGDNIWTGYLAERNALVSTDGENLVTTKDAIIAGYNYVLVDSK